MESDRALKASGCFSSWGDGVMESVRVIASQAVAARGRSVSIIG